MGINDNEIWLLNNDPGELISVYQELITIIVLKYKRLGFVPERETEDLIQAVNQRLLERIDKIQQQYNGKSKLRTYFSVIIRNICREEFRKNPRIEEPQPPEYHKLEKAETPLDDYLVRQEYERFEKVLILLFEDKARFVLMLRYLLNLEISGELVTTLYKMPAGVNEEAIVKELNVSEGYTKKEKYNTLSEILGILEGSITSADSLRKWFTSRSNECIDRMNGNPPRSGYNLESIQILIEKYEILKK